MPLRGWTAVGLWAVLASGCTCDPAGPGDGGELPAADGGPCVPPASPSPCRVGACDGAGNPVLLPLPDGTAVSEQQPRDCKRKVCVGGAVAELDDDTDVADDGNACTDELCGRGLPSNPPRSIGARCDGGVCDGAGRCVECLTASQCPGVDTECRVRTCSGGRCGVASAGAGTPVAAQTPGDCKRLQCSGDGGVVSAVDDADVNEDGNACTIDACSGGVPSRTNAAPRAPCGVNLLCNAGGQCVGCIGPSDCGGPLDCRTRTCTGGVCGVANAPNDAGCNDGNLCTQVDRCFSGVCLGLSPLVCDASDQCHLPGTCVPDAGICTNPAADAGAPCAGDGGTCDGAGVCALNPPFVTGTAPAEGAVDQPPATEVLVSFSEAMAPGTLSAQTAEGVCAGSLQLSVNAFASCLPMAAATPAMQGGNTGALLTPRPRLSCGSTYQVRATGAAQAQSDGRALAPYTSPAGFTTESCFDDHRGAVAISAMYPGAPDAGASYVADYVELHNRGDQAVALAGWSLQLAPETGATWTPVPLAGSIAPGAYFLVQVSDPGQEGAALPTPDVPGPGPGLSPSGGRVLLATTAVAMTGACPSSSNILDYLGWGAGTASCLEGAPPATAPADNAAALARAQNGCQDTGANAADFTLLAAAPRNSAAAPFACATANESSEAGEADACSLVLPLTIDLTSGQDGPPVSGQLFEAGLTEAAGAPAGVRAQLGYGPAPVNPSTEAAGWVWVEASWSMQVGNADEFQATFPAPPPGTWRYGFRFSLGGQPWTYCDADGAGSNAGLRFDPGQLGAMTVTP